MNIKHLPLIVGITLPVFFVLVISVVIFAPSFFMKPQHNFIYATEGEYYGGYGYMPVYKNTYAVEGGKIVLKALPPVQYADESREAPNLYIYDVKTQTSRVVSLDEVKNYVIDPGPSSPDGYTVEYEYGHNGIFELFGSNNNNTGYFISKGNAKKKLNGFIGDRYWNQRSIIFIGWIK